MQPAQFNGKSQIFFPSLSVCSCNFKADGQDLNEYFRGLVLCTFPSLKCLLETVVHFFLFQDASLQTSQFLVFLVYALAVFQLVMPLFSSHQVHVGVHQRCRVNTSPFRGHQRRIIALLLGWRTCLAYYWIKMIITHLSHHLIIPLISLLLSALMRVTKSESKLVTLPKITTISTLLQQKAGLSSPFIDRTQHSIALMKQIKVTKNESDTSSDTSFVMRRLESGKDRPPPLSIAVIKPNEDKKNYLKAQYVKEDLVGEEAVRKFYERYKGVAKAQDKESFLRENNTLTSIVALMESHSFMPRKLDLIKLHGNEAILDLRKLSLGQGKMGGLVIELMRYIGRFQQVDLSHNRIDAQLAGTLVDTLGSVKRINLSYNRIGRVGCIKFSEIFLKPKTQIIELNLEENNLLDNAGVCIIDNLCEYGQLRKLNLSQNYLAIKTAQALKKVLTQDQNLLELYIGWNDFNTKAVKLILEGVSLNFDLKIFDFCWNSIDDMNVPILAKIFEKNDNLVHADFSFCQISLKSVAILSKSLASNHSLYGLHFQGNSGYINHKGFLLKSEKEHSEYPLPILKGIIRKMDGLRPNPNNEFKFSTLKDICWICSSWQERRFSMKAEDAKECFLHLEHEQYEGLKMQFDLNTSEFVIYRMCPTGSLIFFFTVGLSSTERQTCVSPEWPSFSGELNLEYFLGKTLTKSLVRARNILTCDYETDPLNCYYLPNVKSLPRSSDLSIQISENVVMKRKKKIIRQQKANIEFKTFDSPDYLQFISDQGDHDFDKDYIWKCIEFDIANSKIAKVIKDANDLNDFKGMLERYYRDFKDAFYYLARGYSNLAHIYSIDEFNFEKFLEEQRYVSKRVTHAKIMLKLYSCISVNEVESEKRKVTSEKMISEAKLISRPQFLQFLVRMALEKWCPVKIAQKKDDALLDKKESQQIEDKEEDENEPKKIKLPLPLLEGLERTMKTLKRYADEYRSSIWRRTKYLRPDGYVVYKAYRQFLSSLFQKYVGGRLKPNKPKVLNGLLTLEELRAILIESGLKRSKQSMKEAELAFMDAKRLEIEDGQLQFGLNLDQFVECLARYSQTLWYNPLAAVKKPIWDDEVNRKNTPFFLRFQALIANLYRRFPQFHTKKMNKVCQKGIFEQQMEIVLEKVEQLKPNANSLLLKMNTMDDSSEISLQQIIEGLKVRYANATVKREQEVEQDFVQEVII